jgi:hypothetical protein
MRELRHPWLLMHSQDRKSRQRCTKPRRQYELSGATSQLSLGYLFCHQHDLLNAIVGSLSPAFTPVSLAIRETVKQTFAFALCSRFPTRMSLSLGPIDTFSTGSRPRQTARLLLSSLELATLQRISSITILLRFAETKHRRSYLCYVSHVEPQQQVAVKVHKVFASH